MTVGTYGHKVHRAAADPRPRLQSLVLGVDALEGRQQGRVDVQEFACRETHRAFNIKHLPSSFVDKHLKMLHLGH
jgi:hypothetical protein